MKPPEFHIGIYHGEESPARSLREEALQFEIPFFERLVSSLPNDVPSLEILASHYTSAGMIQEGLRLDRRIVRLNPQNPTAYYNLACSLCLSGRRRDALKALRQAWDFGYDNLDWLLKDEDLSGMAGYRPFHDFIDQVRTRKPGE